MTPNKTEIRKLRKTKRKTGSSSVREKDMEPGLDRQDLVDSDASTNSKEQLISDGRTKIRKKEGTEKKKKGKTRKWIKAKDSSAEFEQHNSAKSDTNNSNEGGEKNNEETSCEENESSQKGEAADKEHCVLPCKEKHDTTDSAEKEKNPVRFHEMGLDDRLLKAITLLKWSEPTTIQEKAIPLFLDGKDILSRARTGSGKTGAYAIPIIHMLLSTKRSTDLQHTATLVLVPSRELSTQVTDMFDVLSSCCHGAISCVNVSREDAEVESSISHQNPDIIVGTPSQVHFRVKAKLLDPSLIQWLVIDEADLVLSFGYESDIKKIVPSLPNSYQTFVTSATFTDDINSLKNLVLKNPVTLQLRESALPSSDRLVQYHVICDTEGDKYLLLCALLKLRLVRGKSIIFVNSITRCYRVKLFLEQFSIFCCILNSELPVKSRYHTVEQFNKGLYDYIIAADETQLMGSDAARAPKSKRKKGRPKEFGVSRGVDFQKVSNVINFDFPQSVDAYVHRVGRTARGFASGAALSFVTGDEITGLKEAQGKLGENAMRPYQFAMDQIEGFRYRCRDAVRLVTKEAIKDARLRELRTEMLNSAKLQAYFEENPNDLHVLRHNTALRPSKVKPHMKHVPEYLIPDMLKGIAGAGLKRRRNRTHGGDGAKSRINPKYKRKREDPLQSFKYVEKAS